jgi:hypothetical protein
MTWETLPKNNAVFEGREEELDPIFDRIEQK